MTKSNQSSDEAQSRRRFLKSTSLATAATVVAPAMSRGQDEGSILKVGLIGCGGRGSGAANQALTADANAQIWAMGDVFESQLNNSRKNLTKQKEGQVDVPQNRQFLGLDAYEKVLASGVDVVILTTPPGFRPQHLKAAIDAGKHVFCEKPVAVDAPGIRSVLESAEKAKQKKLNIVCGFCWRYDFARRAAYQRIHDGAIGDVRSVYATYHTGPVKPMPPASARRDNESDVAWQLRNWYNFSWLGGDGLVEQAVHSVDKIAWTMGDIEPVAAVGVGGRQIPAKGGNIFDHFHIVYEYPESVFCQMGSRQQTGCHSENHDYISGSNGHCKITWDGPVIRGKENWRYKDETNDMYQEEHNTLFGHIRSGDYINDGEWLAKSSMLAIMGRMAAYTGQRVTWKQAMESELDLAPDDLEWDDSFQPTGLPRPGQTKFI
jgi:predicted dehydrogenase